MPFEVIWDLIWSHLRSFKDGFEKLEFVLVRLLGSLEYSIRELKHQVWFSLMFQHGHKLEQTISTFFKRVGFFVA